MRILPMSSGVDGWILGKSWWCPSRCRVVPYQGNKLPTNPDLSCRTSWLQRVDFCSTFNTQLFASTRWHRSSWSTWAVILGHPGPKEAATHCVTCLQRASRSFSTKKPLRSYLICKFLLKAKKQKLQKAKLTLQKNAERLLLADFAYEWAMKRFSLSQHLLHQTEFSCYWLFIGLWQIEVALVKAANKQNIQTQPGFICELGCSFLITGLLLKKSLKA